MHLGDHKITPEKFPELQTVFEEFLTLEFKNLNDMQKSERVNSVLLQLIQKTPLPAFLLGPVIDFIDQINRKKILDVYAFLNFELWLNQFSGLSLEENYKVRASITGKWVARDDYQLFFPIGMGKRYPGSHYVTAHSSPDLDTTVASFWGWVDAFSARVSEGLHLWNVPGGAPASQVEVDLLFHQVFGENIFHHLAKTRTSLTLSSTDLINQKGVIKKQTNELMINIDHDRGHSAVVVVDELGYFLGDWRNVDVEGVRQVIMLLNSCLRWFESDLHVRLIALFSKEQLTSGDFFRFIESIFETTIKDSQPTQEFTLKQKRHLQDYLLKVLKVNNGLESTFKNFAFAMKELSILEFQEFFDLLESLQKSSLFDQSGHLIENRPRIFHYVEKIIRGLDRAIQSVRNYVERLDVGLSIKSGVFDHLPQVISHRAEVEEIRSKIGVYSYLTVASPDKDGRMIPLGVVYANDLHKSILGTVSLRDFCNREETKIPSYLEVISVIDHHKSMLSTFSPPVAVISDSQSSNALVAELTFQINDKYSTGGMSATEISKQITEVSRDLSSSLNKRLLQRLLQRQIASERSNGFFIDPKREFVEYLHYLYAILDDTDLLTKVSARDVLCVASLLNRLKSLLLKKEVEVISFDDLQHTENFAEKAAARILQNVDMYSLYQKIYLAKENAVEQNLRLCAEGKSSVIFLDTKEQNGCCRVGQTKMFANNFKVFLKYAPDLCVRWYEEARTFYRERPEVDLHMQMMSTVASAEDLFSGETRENHHKDELWIWIPMTEQAIEHLKSFLNAFRSAPALVNNQLEVEFPGENAKELDQIFSESFMPIQRKKSEKSKTSLPIAILRYRAGSINSRKAVISPCLPKL